MNMEDDFIKDEDDELHSPICLPQSKVPFKESPNKRTSKRKTTKPPLVPSKRDSEKLSPATKSDPKSPQSAPVSIHNSRQESFRFIENKVSQTIPEVNLIYSREIEKKGSVKKEKMNERPASIVSSEVPTRKSSIVDDRSTDAKIERSMSSHTVNTEEIEKIVKEKKPLTNSLILMRLENVERVRTREFKSNTSCQKCVMF